MVTSSEMEEMFESHMSLQEHRDRSTKRGDFSAIGLLLSLTDAPRFPGARGAFLSMSMDGEDEDASARLWINVDPDAVAAAASVEQIRRLCETGIEFDPDEGCFFMSIEEGLP